MPIAALADPDCAGDADAELAEPAIVTLPADVPDAL
jgi:hypothetical protein